MSNEIPTQIRKALTLVQDQLEKAQLNGTYIITRDNITYITDQQTHSIHVELQKQKSDAQRLHERLPEFIADL